MPAQTIQTMPREEFIEKNLGLVHACAGRFKSRGIEYEELYAAGCLGLVKAVDGFDTTRGVCFSTYAVPVILGEIKKLFRDGGTVKVSRSLKELGLKVNAERERCLKHTGQEPGVAQLAEILQTTPEQIALAIRASLPALSLTPSNDEDGNREWDVPVDSPEETLADRIGLREVMDKLWILLSLFAYFLNSACTSFSSESKISFIATFTSSSVKVLSGTLNLSAYATLFLLSPIFSLL